MIVKCDKQSEQVRNQKENQIYSLVKGDLIKDQRVAMLTVVILIIMTRSIGENSREEKELTMEQEAGHLVPA